MTIQQITNHTFTQLKTMLDSLSAQQYTMPCAVMQNGTIGQHLRHVIELYQCLANGYESGTVNYDKRKRDLQMETDKDFAAYCLNQLQPLLQQTDKMLHIESDLLDTASGQQMHSNFVRELVYNMEHTIHHMAIMRPAIQELTGKQLPETFGVAPSTLKYRATCAQ